MVIKLPDTIQNVFLCGDLHGNLEFIKYQVNQRHLTNSCIIVCGDVGLGFQPKWEEHMINLVNKKLVETGCYCVCLSGNHDNPARFTDVSLVKADGSPRNWLNVPNYTVISVCNQNILCVGGAISVDRMYRIHNNVGYWADEQVKYQPKVEERIDVICSHSAPSFCYPKFKGEFVYGWARRDSSLLADMDIERNTLDKVYEDYKDTVKYWYYGHFHQSNVEFINNCKFTLLNIEEIKLHEYNDKG